MSDPVQKAPTARRDKEERKPWVNPEVRRLNASAAEINTTNSADSEGFVS